MTHLALELASVLYLGAGLYGVTRRAEPSALRAVHWALGLGVLLQTAAIWGMHRGDVPVPLESFPAALALIGWGIAAVFLAALAFARVSTAGPWVALLALLFTGLADVGLWLVAPPPEPAGSSAWSHAHVLLSTAGFAVLALASLAGAGYLAKERTLKHKQSGRALPSLESLDRVEHATLSVGFALLTLGVVSGFLWGRASGLSPWTGHSLFLLLAWLVYLLPVSVRLLRHQHGSRPSLGVVVGFAVLVFSYLGIRLLGAVA